uniref:Uncharacterized protein n=1 Tax=uncultured marine group II/III euryarchaeote KM3_74_D01 TaxID=1456502 RepID=A0A075HMN5_9EURY|nr:hypothetical protein [uncultured marine group II/III euryarchaeote KM3_74_D01]
MLTNGQQELPPHLLLCANYNQSISSLNYQNYRFHHFVPTSNHVQNPSAGLNPISQQLIDESDLGNKLRPPKPEFHQAHDEITDQPSHELVMCPHHQEHPLYRTFVPIRRFTR